MSITSDMQNMPTTTTPSGGGFLQQNVLNPISNAFSGGVNEAVSGYKQATSGGFGDLLSGTGHMITGAGAALSAPLAPILQRPLGAVVGGISNAISDNPTVQQFASSPAGQATANVASGVNQAANVVGTVGGAMGAGDAMGNIWDKAYNGSSALDTATNARNTAAAQGVTAQNNMIDQVGQYKNDLGTNFKGAATNIEQANPSARLNLTSEQVDALQTLKNNKSFSLPSYLKTDATPDSLSSINTQHSLTPTQAQDLITQLNKSTFLEKSSGLSVDQTKIGLTNDIKDSANQAFGGLKDSQGNNNVWGNAYKQYAAGRTAIDSIHDIVNLKPDATPTDLNNSYNKVLNLAKTPEGKITLQNAISEFKNTSGIDLTNPTEAMAKTLDANEAFQKAVQGGYIKQMFEGAANPKFVGRRIIGGTVMGAIGIYALGSAIRKALTQ